ncbi:MAG: 30S ribosomal protein S17 [Gammaproteobacteria bacterium]|nr:30S ribosomal protein S17 [Gammaproteobacteria bacterium]
MTAEQTVTAQTPSRTVVGKVISNKMDKTIVVEVERKIKHPLYGKYIRRSSKMYAHDDKNTCQIGDLVKIANSRPISKTKHWVLVEILEQVEKELTE